MFSIQIAGIPISVEAQYPYTERICENYKINVGPERCAFTVSASSDEIAAENDDDYSFTPAYCESLALYRKICTRMLEYDAFLFHAAILEHNGRGYAFTAKSGTGKSTHISQWVQALENEVSIINGDKPIVRYQNGSFTAYGTPYNGKEGWGENSSAPLSAICFVERGEHDELSRVTDDGEIINRIMNQILLPKDPLLAAKQLDLIDKLLKQVPFYILRCTPTKAAFDAAYQMTMCNNEH